MHEMSPGYEVGTAALNLLAEKFDLTGKELRALRAKSPHGDICIMEAATQAREWMQLNLIIEKSLEP